MPCSGCPSHPPKHRGMHRYRGPLHPPGVPRIPPGVPCTPPPFPWNSRHLLRPRRGTGHIPGAHSRGTSLRPPWASPAPPTRIHSSTDSPAPGPRPPLRCRDRPQPRYPPVPLPLPSRRPRRALTQLSREQTPRQAPMVRPPLRTRSALPPRPRWLRPARPRGSRSGRALPPPPGRPLRRRGGALRTAGNPRHPPVALGAGKWLLGSPCTVQRRGDRTDSGSPARSGGSGVPRGWGAAQAPTAGRGWLLGRQLRVPRHVLSVFTVNWVLLEKLGQVPTKCPQSSCGGLGSPGTWIQVRS